MSRDCLGIDREPRVSPVFALLRCLNASQSWIWCLPRVDFGGLSSWKHAETI